MTRTWRFKNAFKCNKCPQRHDEDGCPDWWEYPNESGQITKGCSRHQDIKLTILLSVLNDARGAAISADKATNAACEATLAAQQATNAASTSAALILGIVTGEIMPPERQIESHNNGNQKVLSRTRPMD